jgi:hypothetical protein
MIERFDSYPDALRDRFDVVLERCLGIRVAEVGLHVLDASELRHVGRTRAAEHLVGDTVDAGLLTGFFEDAEKEIVGVDGGPAR